MRIVSRSAPHGPTAGAHRRPAWHPALTQQVLMAALACALTMVGLLVSGNLDVSSGSEGPSSTETADGIVQVPSMGPAPVRPVPR